MYEDIDTDEAMERRARRHKKHTHGWTWTEPWDEDAAQRHGRDHGTSTRTRTKTQHKDMGETMDGRARRHKGQTHGWTWTEPWDEDAGRDHGTSTKTHTNAWKNLQTHNNVPWPHFLPAAPEKKKAENEYSEV